MYKEIEIPGDRDRNPRRGHRKVKEIEIPGDRDGEIEIPGDRDGEIEIPGDRDGNQGERNRNPRR